MNNIEKEITVRYTTENKPLCSVIYPKYIPGVTEYVTFDEDISVLKVASSPEAERPHFTILPNQYSIVILDESI